MKSIRKLVVMLVLISMSVCLPAEKSSAQVTVSFQLFYDQLSPHGQWVNYPNTGYVWIPNAGVGFTPYSTGGHWVLSEFGWTWVSDYSWGWAPFHYGRWNYAPPYGWIWIPGNEWGPAWVSWRKSPGYYGWVPMGYGKNNDNDDQHWIFVKDHDIDKTDIKRFKVNTTNNVTIIKNSTVIQNSRTDNNRNVTYNAGPEKDEVQKITGKPVKAVTVENNDKPGQSMSNGQLRIYRPEVQKDNSNDHRPAKVADIKDVQPQSGNKDQHQQETKPGKTKDNKNSQASPKDKPKKENQQPKKS